MSIVPISDAYDSKLDAANSKERSARERTFPSTTSLSSQAISGLTYSPLPRSRSSAYAKRYSDVFETHPSFDLPIERYPVPSVK